MPAQNDKAYYLARLKRLIRDHAPNRRERFLPFAILLTGDTGHARYQEALAIAHYFLDNAYPTTRDDKLFYTMIDEIVSRENPPDYFTYAGKTPYPFSEYLKIIYDLRPEPKNYARNDEAETIKKQVLTQLKTLMKQQNISKSELSKRMNTSRSSLDRLLDPSHSVTLQTLQKASHALGCKINIQFIPSSDK